MSMSNIILDGAFLIITISRTFQQTLLWLRLKRMSKPRSVARVTIIRGGISPTRSRSVGSEISNSFSSFGERNAFLTALSHFPFFPIFLHWRNRSNCRKKISNSFTRDIYTQVINPYYCTTIGKQVEKEGQGKKILHRRE